MSTERCEYRQLGAEKATKVAEAIQSLLDHLDADTREYCSFGDNDSGIAYHEIEDHLEQYQNLSKSLGGRNNG